MAIDIGVELLEKYELENSRINEQIAKSIIDEFLSHTNIDFKSRETTYVQRLTDLKFRYIYNSMYTELFYEYLHKNNYFIQRDIKEAIFNLATLEDPNKNENTILKLLGSPDIIDISFNGKDKFTILSHELGEIDFELADHYFRHDEDMLSYMELNRLAANCHKNVWRISEADAYKDFYAITSFCKSVFAGVYYHSYTWDPSENKVIDLCAKSVFDSDTFNKIYQPEEIISIINRDLSKYFYITEEKTDQYYKRHRMLKIALFKQYLDSIGYEGNLEDAPHVPILK